MRTIAVLLVLFLASFTVAACPQSDANGDCKADMLDFAILAQEWLTEGQIEVPDVVGMTRTQAETTLNNVLLVLGDVTEDYSDTAPEGAIISQNPAAGAMLSPDGAVDIVVSLGPDNRPDITWVYINDPGVDEDGDGTPEVGAFDGYMSKYEVTNAQYIEFLNAAMAAGEIKVVSGEVQGVSYPNTDVMYYDLDSGHSQIRYSNNIFSIMNYSSSHDVINDPVVDVSQIGAQAFCDFYGWRLPTHWEWRAVADYDGSYLFGCGATIDQTLANYYDSDYANPAGRTHQPYTGPVGSYAAFGYGLCDMAGSVFEWTSTGSNEYYFYRMGGSWSSSEVQSKVTVLPSKQRYQADYYTGFRVCR